MTKKSTKTQLEHAEIHLPYFKQGDDLMWALKDNPPKRAFVRQAEMLLGAAQQLLEISQVIGDTPVEIDAGTHYIGISGPKELIEHLIAEELASKDEFEDEEQAEEEG